MIPTATLAELVEEHGGLIQTGPFGSQLHQSDYSDDGVPVVMPKDIRNGRVDESTIARIPETKAQALSRHFLRPGSIVFPRRGEIGKCAHIDPDQAGYLCGTGCIKIEPPEDVLRSRFLYYFLGFGKTVEWLERNAVGTTMLNLSTKILGGLGIPLPPLQIQDSVVSILSAYDDLIENNNRRIQLLEKAARMIYKEWFVTLRFPGYEQVRIREGVPEGWERKKLGNLVEIKKGQNITKNSSTDGSVPVIAGGMSPAYYHTKANVDGPVVTISASGANAGYVSLYHEDIWASDCSYISTESTDRLYFFYSFLKSKQREIFGFQKGAAQPHVYPKDLERLTFLAPKSVVVDMFEESVEDFFHKKRLMVEQNKLLVQARDLLLPRLISGKIEL